MKRFGQRTTRFSLYVSSAIAGAALGFLFVNEVLKRSDLKQLHAETRARVFGFETVEEAKDILDQNEIKCEECGFVSVQYYQYIETGLRAPHWFKLSAPSLPDKDLDALDGDTEHGI